MAVSFVQGVTFSSGTSPTNSGSLTSVAAGDIIVTYVVGNGGATGLVTGVTDSMGNTYHQVSGFDIANASGTLNMDLWWTQATTAGSAVTLSVSFNSSLTNIAGIAQQFTGYTKVVTLDKFARAANASNTSTSSGATATTTNANELVVGGSVHASTASAYSLGTGYSNLTQLSIANNQPAMESKLVTATGAQTATFTIAAARASITGVATFYETTTALPTPSATGEAKVWNGSAWVAKPVKYWNGSAWTTKPMKYWNGTAWVTTTY